MTSQLPNEDLDGAIAVDPFALGDPQSWQLWRSVLPAACGLELDADVRLRSINFRTWFRADGTSAFRIRDFVIIDPNGRYGALDKNVEVARKNL